jgi:hypothetical protein
MNKLVTYTGLLILGTALGFGLAVVTRQPISVITEPIVEPVQDIVQPIVEEPLQVVDTVKEVLPTLPKPDLIKPVKKRVGKIVRPLIELESIEGIDALDQLNLDHTLHNVPDAFKVIPDVPDVSNAYSAVQGYRPMIYRAIFDTTLTRNQRWRAIGFAVGEIAVTTAITYYIMKPPTPIR